MEAVFELIGVLFELFFSKDERRRAAPVRLATPASGGGMGMFLPTTGRSYGRKAYLASRRRNGRQGGIGPRRR